MKFILEEALIRLIVLFRIDAATTFARACGVAGLGQEVVDETVEDDTVVVALQGEYVNTQTDRHTHIHAYIHTDKHT